MQTSDISNFEIEPPQVVKTAKLSSDTYFLCVGYANVENNYKEVRLMRIGNDSCPTICHEQITNGLFFAQ